MMACKRYMLRLPDGREFGPASMDEVIRRRQEGRMPPEASLIDTQTGDEKPVSECPSLNIRVPPPGVNSGVPPPPIPAITIPPQVARNGYATWAGIVGSAGFFLCGFPGPAAIVLGILGLRRAAEIGVGHGLALTGLILGALQVLGLLGALFWFAVPSVPAP
jgi:hypothetical protein